ncbi:hypothetical protein HCU66_25945 [Pseudomonas frederiksbergensis]|uniref:hypothetical protein n=1 Tax=Pseudomonas frederiksbergensis TaxID=104087 RepID=UPI00197DED9E|nr:hypothetical protein [Pseudomonas frederiksbergensis]MBN3865641.1 hypothetical protein [Pseudomonas frederiksbergensis]
MTEQGKADAQSRGYEVRLEERRPFEQSFWVYFSGNQVGGPYGAEGDAWNYVQVLINQQTYGM